MQTQSPRMKGDELCQVRLRTVTTTIRDISPNGVRLERNDTGQVRGKYNAARTQTVNILMKPDGTTEWETKAVDTTPDGDMVFLSGNGRGRIDGEKVVWDGEMRYLTRSQRFSWLNNTNATIEGTADMATGDHQATMYAKK